MLRFDIFDSEAANKLQLLYLLYRKNGWYSVDELVLDSHLERKTVLKYTKELANDLVVENDDGKATSLDFSKGKGIRFTGGQLGYLEAIPIISEQSISLTLIKELFFQSKVSLDRFLQKYFVSESTVRRKIKHFNTLIQKYGLKIRSVNRELNIEGSELQFRYLSYIIFWNIYRGMSWPFPTIDQQKIVSFIKTEMKSYSSFNDIAATNWSYMIAINLYRYNQKKEVTQEDLPSFAHQLNQDALSLTGKHSSMMTYIQKYFHISVSEADFLCLLFQLRSGFLLIPKISKRLLAAHKSLNTPINQMYQVYIDTIKPDLASVDEQTKIAYHSVLYVGFLTDVLFPNFSTTLSGYDYTRYLKQNYPFLRAAMLEKLHIMQKNTRTVSFTNEEMLVARFCEAHALIQNPTIYSPPVYIQMETDLPIIMEKVIAKQIESFLQPFYNVSFVSSTSSIKKHSIDVIIASTTSPLLFKRTKKIPVVYINPGFRLTDIVNLINVIENKIEAREKI